MLLKIPSGNCHSKWFEVRLSVVSESVLFMVGHGIVAVAFVGKSNEPLYFYSEEDTAEALNLQMIVYGSLDVVEEKIKK